MKVRIVFHSVCGNTYLMARAFERVLTDCGSEVLLRRVADTDWVEKPDVPQNVRHILAEMRALPEAKPEDLLQADLVLMGSPVYFGNVSAELKAFIDSTGSLWFQGKMTGRKFAAFVSAGNAEGGGDLALQALHTYATYMGMLTVPLPIRLSSGKNTNAFGIIQYSDGKVTDVLDANTTGLIERWARSLKV